MEATFIMMGVPALHGGAAPQPTKPAARGFFYAHRHLCLILHQDRCKLI
jgi:hypothetical protein